MATKLSIIVPIYNTEAYLRTCIDSLIKQSYKDIEIILVDDGSQDASGKICDEYAMKNDNITVLHKENGGNTSARIAGIEAASGDWIGFVDSDDWVEKDWFSRLMAVGLKEGVDTVFGSYVKEQYASRTLVDILHQRLCCEADEALLSLLKGINKSSPLAFTASFWCVVAKREIIKNIKFRKDIIYWEDLLGVYNILCSSRQVAYIPYRGYHYMQRQNSLTRNRFNKKKLQYVDVPIMIEKDVREKFAASPLLPEIQQQIDMVVMRSLIMAMYQMLERPVLFAAELAKYKDILAVYEDKCEILLTGKLRELYRLVREPVAVATDKIQKNREFMLHDVKALYEQKGRVFIYGMGKIAGEVATFFSENNIDFQGFIVSEKVAIRQEMADRKILSLAEAVKEYSGQVFVAIAMNKKNTMTVMQLLKAHDIPYINLGKYSRMY